MKENINRLQERIRNQQIHTVDLKFVDLMGRIRHVSIPAGSFSEDLITSGVGFDGSSVGFKSVKSGDMCLIPDLDTAFIDPFWERPTLAFFCDIVEADTREGFIGDPRSVAQRALDHLRNVTDAHQLMLLPELEFYIFKTAAFWETPMSSCRVLQSEESHWDRMDDEYPSGYAMPLQNGYHSDSPVDLYRNVRAEIVDLLEKTGISVKYHHHEVGAAGQQEIELSMAPMLDACDQAMLVKYYTKNTALTHGLTTTFMPKPIPREAGSGMHMHIRLVDREQKPLFYQDGDEIGLSEMAYCFIGGIIQHGPALAAFTNPSINSYRRLVRGYEAPTNLFFSIGSRNSAIRIPKYATTPDKKRFEIRSPDATCNIYFAISAILMAGIDGIRKGIHAREMKWGPYNDIVGLPRAVQRRIPCLPDSLDGALAALQKDHEFLTAGEVFNQALIDGWIKVKHDRELEPLRHIPTPFEFEKYFNC